MPAIHTESLRKVYPPSGAWRASPRSRPGPPGSAPPGRAERGATEVVALHGLDLEVSDGEFFGLLGPNGAGKTTTIGILTTRVLASGGRARVAGHDVVADPVSVRRCIGVVPQRPNADRALNVEENLLFHAAYFGLPAAEARRRASALLQQLGIADRGHHKVDALSGGQQQRLMIARALIHEPAVIFLDEPTVGLDPQARLSLWGVLGELHAQGRTIVMTTHYMEEAERLCGRVGIMDHGRLLALDTLAALKGRAPGGTIVDVELDAEAEVALAGARALPGVEDAETRGRTLRVRSALGGRVVSAVIAAVEGSGRHVRNISLTEPSLESLFIALTGRKIE